MDGDEAERDAWRVISAVYSMTEDGVCGEDFDMEWTHPSLTPKQDAIATQMCGHIEEILYYASATHATDGTSAAHVFEDDMDESRMAISSLAALIQLDFYRRRAHADRR